MIVSTLIAASLASQPSPAPQTPASGPAPAAAKKMACCEKMAKGEGCACCKDMGKEQHGEHGMKEGAEGAGAHAH